MEWVSEGVGELTPSLLTPPLLTSQCSGGGEESEFGVCGVVGGKMVIELLAYAMRSVRGRISAVDMRGAPNGECDNIRNV
mgnify:CR=1 FL=1